MCQVGDIILIDNYEHNGLSLSRHSFIVLNDEEDQIQGLNYDLICNVMSSFKNEEQKKKKLSYPGNFPIVPDDLGAISGNNKSGYVKADQLYYFKKTEINYVIIGSIKEDIFKLLIEFIESLENIEAIIDNL